MYGPDRTFNGIYSVSGMVRWAESRHSITTLKLFLICRCKHTSNLNQKMNRFQFYVPLKYKQCQKFCCGFRYRFFVFSYWVCFVFQKNVNRTTKHALFFLRFFQGRPGLLQLLHFWWLYLRWKSKLTSIWKSLLTKSHFLKLLHNAVIL